MNKELLTYYSMGVLSDHVINGNPDVMVIPLDKTQIMPQGEIIPSRMNVAVTPEAGFQHRGKDANGRSYSVNVVNDTSVLATFLSSNPNQTSIPLLRTGAKVRILQEKGTGRFFWEPLNLDGNLAERDNQVETYAATGDDKSGGGVTKSAGGDNNVENSYIFTRSPANGEISTITSMANGEPASWQVQLNTKDGAAIVKDSKGNIVQIDAVRGRITLRNSYDCFIDMDQKNLTINVPENLIINVGKNVTWTTGGDYKESITGKEEFNVGGESKSTYGGNVNIQAPQHDTKCPVGSFTGQLSIGGMSVVGGGGGSGNAEIKGNVKANGNMNADGDVKAGSISLQRHKHREQGDGAPTSSAMP